MARWVIWMDTAVVPCAWGAPGLGLEVDRLPLTSVIASDLERSDVGLVGKVKIPIFLRVTFNLERNFMLRDFF